MNKDTEGISNHKITSVTEIAQKEKPKFDKQKFNGCLSLQLHFSHGNLPRH